MIYIEKNDKPNFLEKNLCLIKNDKDTIYVPLLNKLSDKKVKKIANRTVKVINKMSNSKKVVIDKELKKEPLYLNYLNSYDLKISDGKWLFRVMLLDIIDYIIIKKKLKKPYISILINDLNEIEYENIKKIARKFNTINIITNHIEKFKKLENELYENEGIIITITNNKKKSLKKSNIIINYDFPDELINKYCINENAIIINEIFKIKVKNKRFNGLCINDFEIDYRDDIKYNKEFSNRYFYKDIYESNFYKKQVLDDIYKKIKQDKVIITKLILNNGEL